MDDFYLNATERKKIEIQKQLEEIENLVNIIEQNKEYQKDQMKKRLKTQKQINKLNQNIVNFLDQGYNRLLVVEKDIEMGPRGGQYYKNPEGQKVYLKSQHREKCNKNQLKGSLSGCQ